MLIRYSVGSNHKSYDSCPGTPTSRQCEFPEARRQGIGASAASAFNCIAAVCGPGFPEQLGPTSRQSETEGSTLCVSRRCSRLPPAAAAARLGRDVPCAATMRNVYYSLQGGGDAAGSFGRAAGCAVEVITSSWRRLFILINGPGQEHI